MVNNFKRFTPFIVCVGDLLALFAFVIIGQSDHATLDAAHPILGALALTLDFAIPWIVAGWFLGAFQVDPSEGRQFAYLTRALNTWLVAGPFGILIRALILGRALIPTPFFIAAMGLGGTFVIIWRVAFIITQRLTIRPMASRS